MMRFSIKDIIEKSKYLIKHLENKEIFTVLTIILVAFASFGLGRLSKIEDSAFPVRVENTASVLVGAGNELPKTIAVPKQASTKEGSYVASKTGEKYHLPWCSGAQRIKEENKVWFNSKEAAEQAGYTPAANCKGL
ncbi:MAG: hypothetical protein NUV49_01545 [Patescibacteria group bacterium]|nr:hypothetical protein [Patescibacteria group bacterium]